MDPSSPPKVRKCYFSLLCVVVHWMVFVILSRNRNHVHSVEIHPEAASALDVGAASALRSPSAPACTHRLMKKMPP